MYIFTDIHNYMYILKNVCIRICIYIHIYIYIYIYIYLYGHDSRMREIESLVRKVIYKITSVSYTIVTLLYLLMPYWLVSTSHDKATHTIKRPTHSKPRKQCKYSILYLHCLRGFE
jgi:hypothetical protein